METKAEFKTKTTPRFIEKMSAAKAPPSGKGLSCPHVVFNRSSLSFPLPVSIITVSDASVWTPLSSDFGRAKSPSRRTQEQLEAAHRAQQRKSNSSPVGSLSRAPTPVHERLYTDAQRRETELDTRRASELNRLESDLESMCSEYAYAVTPYNAERPRATTPVGKKSNQSYSFVLVLFYHALSLSLSLSFTGRVWPCVYIQFRSFALSHSVISPPQATAMTIK